MWTFNDFLIVLGSIYLAKFCFTWTYEIWSGFRTYIWSRLIPPRDLPKIYGPWAVITGSTDGIGKCYAFELAKRGLNIILISRNEGKLKKTAEEISNTYSVKVIWIQADFEETDIYEKIKNELDQYDIGILINNVGVMTNMPQKFYENSEKYLKQVTNINIFGLLMMTYIVVDNMIKHKRGLIVNLGSQSGVFPVPNISVYSSSKAFVDHFTSCLEVELAPHNIKVQCLRGGFIKTNLIADMTTMISFYEKYLPFFIPDAKKYVESSIATLNTDVTFTAGYWGHTFILTFGQYFGNRWLHTRLSNFLMTNKTLWK